MKNDEARSLPFRLDALVMVCKACGKRSSGPAKNGKPKEVAGEFKGAGKAARLKMRVVMTSCIGLCPKNATAVVVTGGQAGGPTTSYAVEDRLQVAALLPAATPRG
ncbi:hypothetical protein GN316_03815 [Xylophilus sp. Kf1]|nr:hypothetical protein [Xylophilus sp. Kf1]